MASGPDKVFALAALLQQAGAKPRVRADHVVRSTIYDLDYHISLVACVFFTNAERRTDDTRRVVAHWLKLLQFIAVRPALLPDFEDWAKARRRRDLDIRQKMPRGYLGDRTHDRTVELLLASQVLFRTKDALVSGERFDVLQDFYEAIVENDLLISERNVLRAVAHTRVNKTLLRGK